MRVFFVKKKWKMGFFCKKVDLSSTQGALCKPTVSVFFTFYLFGVPTHPSHRLPTGLEQKLKSILPASLFHIGATNSAFVADP